MSRHALVACAFVASLLAPLSGTAGGVGPAEPPNARVRILFGEFSAPLSEEVQADPPSLPPAPVPVAPVVDPAVVNYLLRTSPPDVLIRYYFADTPHVEKMLAIAKRESGLGKGGRVPVPFDPACSADNPRSSAAGLFQTLGGWSGLASTLDPPVTWAEVAGPDCLGDVRLARAIYARSGLGPWQ